MTVYGLDRETMTSSVMRELSYRSLALCLYSHLDTNHAISNQLSCLHVTGRPRLERRANDLIHRALLTTGLHGPFPGDRHPSWPQPLPPHHPVMLPFVEKAVPEERGSHWVSGASCLRGTHARDIPVTDVTRNVSRVKAPPAGERGPDQSDAFFIRLVRYMIMF